MDNKSKPNNPCAICGGQVKLTTITHEERRGNQLYLFQNVPAQVCGACGEIWIDEAVLQEIDQLIESGQPVRQVQTPVFDMAAYHSRTQAVKLQGRAPLTARRGVLGHQAFRSACSSRRLTVS